MRVAVLGGGRSSEHEISLASASAVRGGLAQAGHDVVDVRLEREGAWSHEGDAVAIEPGAGVLAADVVFPVLHGPFGEDGSVQGLLEIADVPYVGAGVLASAVCMDKVTFKDLMARTAVPQVDYLGLREPVDHAAVEELGFPMFVKPSRLGSSVGISKVESAADLDHALTEAFRHDPLVIAEAASRGLEVECSVIGNELPEVSQPGQIVLNADWYDYEAKYQPGGMELVVPAGVDLSVRERVRELAREVFIRVGCAGLARVDFFVEDGGEVLVNELNTMPGFTETSVFPKLWEASGLPFPELLDRLVTLAVERHEAERRYRF